MDPRPRLERTARLVAVGAVYLAASLWVGLEWLGLDRQLRVTRAVMPAGGITPAQMIHGTAPKPFVLRTLVPSTVRLLHAALPDDTARRWWLKVLRRNPRLVAELPYLEWEEEYLLEYLIAVAVMHTCLLGFVVALRALYGHLYPDPGWRRDLLPLLALLCLPFFFAVGTHFLYDFATLLFFALGLLLMERRRWAVYYPVLLLALLNKETAALLVLVFAARFLRDMPRRAWLVHLAAQIALAGAVRSLLLFVFRANEGGTTQWWLQKNLLLVRERGIDWPTVILFGVLVTAVIARSRAEGPLLKAALVMVPPLSLAYVLVGIYGEIRIFYEIVPAGTIWVWNAALALCGLAPSRPAPIRAASAGDAIT